MISIEEIREMFRKETVRMTNHANMQFLERNIYIDDVRYAVMNGEITEQYLNDKPYPSCLISGVNAKGQNIHCVCALSAVETLLITAYYPDTNKWSGDFKIRKEK